MGRLLACILVLLIAPPAGAGWNPLAKETAADQNVKCSETAEAMAAFRNREPSITFTIDPGS